MNFANLMSLIFLFFQFLLTSAQDDLELKFLIIVFNNGLRSPLSTFPKDDYQESSWPRGFGQLTEKGMQAQYELGKYLRERYARYLNSTYLTKEIYIKSLDYDRSLMSAYTLLNGLYPSQDNQMWNSDIHWQPISVHTTPISQDPFLAPCPALEKLWNETLNSKEVKDFLQQFEVYKLAIEVLVGRNLSSVFELEEIFDTLMCESQHGMILHGWTSNLSSVFLSQIYPFYQMAYHNSTNAKRLISGQLLKEVVKFFNLRRENLLDSHLKAYFLSADDKMIRSLMSGLDVYNFGWIPFSATVMLELRYSEEIGYFVNIFFKNETHDPILLMMPGCDGNCSLDLFLNLTQDVITENWNMECHPFHGLTFIKIAQSIFLVTMISVVIVVIFICCSVICCRRRRISRKYSEIRTDRINFFPEEMPMMNASSVASSDLED